MSEFIAELKRRNVLRVGAAYLVASWLILQFVDVVFPMFGLDGADAFVYRQIGYSIADVLAKCLYGLLIFKIARIKSFDDDPEFAAQELKEDDIPAKA